MVGRKTNINAKNNFLSILDVASSRRNIVVVVDKKESTTSTKKRRNEEENVNRHVKRRKKKRRSNDPDPLANGGVNNQTGVSTVNSHFCVRICEKIAPFADIVHPAVDSICTSIFC